MNIATLFAYTFAVFFTGMWIVMGAVDFNTRGSLTKEARLFFFLVVALYIFTGFTKLFIK